MKRWKRALALALVLLMGAVALAEDMTLPEKIAAAEIHSQVLGSDHCPVSLTLTDES